MAGVNADASDRQTSAKQRGRCSYVSILRDASRIVKETKNVSILLKKVLDVLSLCAELEHVSVTLIRFVERSQGIFA